MEQNTVNKHDGWTLPPQPLHPYPIQGLPELQPRLPLPDHVHGSVSLDRSPCRVEFTKALLGLHSSFDRSMILLQDVVQVLDRPVAATASQDSFLFHS